MISATATAETTPDHCVAAPACWLIAERVSEPEPGMHWKKLPVKLASALATGTAGSCRASGASARRWPWPSRSPRAGRAARSRARRSRGSRICVGVERAAPRTHGRLRGDLADHRDAVLVEPELRREQRHADHHEQQVGQQAQAEPLLRASAAPAPRAIAAEADRRGLGRGSLPPSVSVRQKRHAGSGRARRRSPCRPSRFLIWSSTSSAPAPSVKPTITECEM